MNTLIKILEDNLIGKSVRVRTQWKQIKQEKVIKVKKHNGVTKKQFESGLPNFVRNKIIEVPLGFHSKYETLKIKGVKAEMSDDICYGTPPYYYNVILENDMEYSLEPDTEIITI